MTEGNRKNSIKKNTTDERGVHITREEWIRFSKGAMNEKEEEKLYDHVGCCTYCAEQFANIVELDFFAEPPAYLYEEIVDRSKKVDVQAAVVVKKTSKQVRLLMYSLKVGFAVAASIFLMTVATAAWQSGIELPQEPLKQNQTSVAEKINRESGRITGSIHEATNKLLEIQLKEETK